jgi:hypothetical protein
VAQGNARISARLWASFCVTQAEEFRSALRSGGVFYVVPARGHTPEVFGHQGQTIVISRPQTLPFDPALALILRECTSYKHRHKGCVRIFAASACLSPPVEYTTVTPPPNDWLHCCAHMRIHCWTQAYPTGTAVGRHHQQSRISCAQPICAIRDTLCTANSFFFSL